MGVEKLRNLPLLMCLVPMSGVILGTVALVSSLIGGISGYALESSSLFWGYLRWMPKEEYQIVYFLLFAGKIIFNQMTTNEETLFATCPDYWSLVLYQHCSKIKEQTSEERILLKTCLKRLIVHCMAGDLAAAEESSCVSEASLCMWGAEIGSKRTLYFVGK